jgi:hypothetical protein
MHRARDVALACRNNVAGQAWILFPTTAFATHWTGVIAEASRI